ncbi:MAG: HD domain-containing phosphohydrolase [Armatimonadota bacterium]|nr:HD domain-containing phosphohydrolase [Armatimonadota bacterium]MDR5697204.1 HD domain-containing phosphohydrolase [Armatimonadota bacterium]
MTTDETNRQVFVQGRIPSHWLVEQMPEAIWATDAALRFVAAGGLAARDLDLDPTRVVGATVYEYFQTTDPSYPPLAAHLRALHGETGGYQFARGGHTYLVRTAPVRHGIGRVVGVVACATDVTDLVRLAGQTPERTVLSELPLPVVRVDAQLRVRFANPQARSALGASVAEDAPFDEGPAPAVLVEAAGSALRSGQPSTVDCEGYRWYAAPAPGTSGAPDGAILVGTDLALTPSAPWGPGDPRWWHEWSEAVGLLTTRQTVSEIAQTLVDRACALAGADLGVVRLWAMEDQRLLADVAVGGWEGACWDRLRPDLPLPWGEAVWLDVDGPHARELGLAPGGVGRALAVTAAGALVRGIVCLAWEQGDPPSGDQYVAPVMRLVGLAQAVASLHVGLDRAQGERAALEAERRLLESWVDSDASEQAAAGCLNTLVSLLRATGGAVYVREGDLWVRAHHIGPREPARTFPVHDGAALGAVLEGRPRMVRPTGADPAFTGEGLEGVHVALASEGLEAVLSVESATDRAFCAADLDVVQTAARHFGWILSRRRADPTSQTERFRAIVDRHPLGMAVLDGGRIVRYVNARATDLLGLPLDEVSGRPLAEFVHPADRATVDAALVRLYAHPDATTDWAARLLRPDAESRWVEFVGRNQMLDPAVGGVVLSLRDVSAERQTWEDLLRQAADLEAGRELAASLRQTYNLREVCVRATERAADLMRADHSALALLDPEGESLTLCHVQGPLEALANASFPLSGVLAEVIGSGRPRRIDWPQGDPIFSERAGFGSTLIVPLGGPPSAIGALCVARRSAGEAFDDLDLRRLQTLADPVADAIGRAQAAGNLERAYIDVVLALARAMDAHDALGSGHGSAVAHWAEAVARRLGCSDQESRDVRWAALLHNVGKVGVPEEILRKTSPLSKDEAALLRQYPVIGAEMLRPAPGLRRVAELVRHQQERWDGTGYPDGLRGEEIPLGSRIIAVADAYNAMTEHRRYKVARGHAEAASELRRGAGAQFDPNVVKVFLDLLAESRAV